MIAFISIITVGRVLVVLYENIYSTLNCKNIY